MALTGSSFDTATGYGDAGDDFLNIWGDASGDGGVGDDVMSLFNGGTATGGAGAETFRVMGGERDWRHRRLPARRGCDRGLIPVTA